METPQKEYPTLREALGITTPLYFKHEDMHPFGSHKGRSLPRMIETAYRSGIRKFAISSSGNAARAAIHAIATYTDATLTVYIGTRIRAHKKDVLHALGETVANAEIVQVDRPLQMLTQASKQGVHSLRQSTDTEALSGYKSLAEELSTIPNLEAIFIPTSSGTTAQALATFLPSVKIVIAQTSSCHPIAKHFDTASVPEEQSIADAIVDRVANRKEALINLLEKNGGTGYIITNNQIEEAMQLTRTHTSVALSPNSALSLAALMRSIQQKKTYTGSIACIVTGI